MHRVFLHQNEIERKRKRDRESAVAVTKLETNYNFRSGKNIFWELADELDDI
jgi:hypothetical protein